MGYTYSLSSAIPCESCGEITATKSIRPSSIEYNHSGKIIELEVDLPVYSCSSCDVEYTDSEAEVVKSNTIRNYLNLLTPSQIKSIRDSYDLTRVEFALLSGFGSASLSRWESGVLIQSRANDNLLRLISVKQNMEILKKNNSVNIVELEEKPVFGSLKMTNELNEKASKFCLTM